MNKLNKKQKEKVIRTGDSLFKFSIIYSLGKLIYGTIFSILFSLSIIGMRYKLFEGYFEYLVIAFILVISFQRADISFSNLPTLLMIPGMGIFIYYLLQGLGYSIQSNVLWFLIKIILYMIIFSLVYNLWLRGFLINKWKLKSFALGRLDD